MRRQEKKERDCLVAKSSRVSNRILRQAHVIMRFEVSNLFGQKGDHKQLLLTIGQ